jgi:hypothetical protein
MHACFAPGIVTRSAETLLWLGAARSIEPVPERSGGGAQQQLTLSTRMGKSAQCCYFIQHYIWGLYEFLATYSVLRDFIFR